MTPRPRSFGARLVALAIRGLLAVVAIGLVAWGALALWFDGPGSRPLAGVLAAGFVAAAFGLPLAARRRGLLGAGLLWVLLLGWWLYIPPRADRRWLPDVAELPTADVQGERVTISNVRDFAYRSETDFTPRWERRTYDLARVQGLDLFMSYWGSPLIAHTIMSWEFDDGRHLAISIETRKEVGESYSALRGFFRQYELYYVVADERDVIGVRTDHRGERVYVYRLAVSPARARALLLAYLDQVNRLARQPVWYNAFTQNCTTTIRIHVQQVGVHNPWDWRLLVNGLADELLYQRGDLNRDLPFPELKARSEITARARAAGDDPQFSARIRDGVPARPPVRG